jgi:hypothetical protein
MSSIEDALKQEKRLGTHRFPMLEFRQRTMNEIPHREAMRTQAPSGGDRWANRSLAEKR